MIEISDFFLKGHKEIPMTSEINVRLVVQKQMFGFFGDTCIFDNLEGNP